VIRGTVTDDGSPTILIPIAGRDCAAVIDTGFNGGVELPEALRPYLNARFKARMRFLLAAGQEVVQDGYYVDFPFDGRPVTVEATFVHGDGILLGTALLRNYRLEIDFRRPHGDTRSRHPALTAGATHARR
jgi:predicted aspartyl protease